MPVSAGEINHYVVSFGASIDWAVHGGGNFWREFKDEYQTNWEVVPLDGTQLDIVDISVQSSAATHSVITVTCRPQKSFALMGQSFNYQVKLTQKSRVSKFLLEPHAHTGSVKISCEPPASQRLLWSQGPNYLAKSPHRLPRSRFLDNNRTHFALVGSQHHVRLMMLDKNGFASLNHSSIVTSVSSSDSSLAEVQQVSASIYDKRFVVVTNTTGTVFLNS